MNIVLVSNDKKEMRNLSILINNIYKNSKIIQFTDPLLCAKYIWYKHVDIVFTEVDMRPVNGIEVLKVVRTKKSNIPFIIIANDNNMRCEAEKLNVSGYWIKPIQESNLKEVKKLL